MEFEEKKDFLKSAYRINTNIKSHVSELARLRASLNSIGGGFGDGTPHSSRYNGDTAQTNNVIKIIDLEAQLKAEIADMEKKWKEVHDAIESLDDVNEKLILRMRYLECRPWSEISQEIAYSIRYVKHLHNRAINNLDL